MTYRNSAINSFRDKIIQRAARRIKRLVFSTTRKQSNRTDSLRYPSVELVWWRPPQGLNFGDVLSEIIVTKILADNDHFLNDQTGQHSRLLALGSILHLARDGDVVW